MKIWVEDEEGEWCCHRAANFVVDYDSMKRMKHRLMTFHHVDDVFSLILSLLLLRLKMMRLMLLLLLLLLSLCLSCDDFEWM